VFVWSAVVVAFFYCLLAGWGVPAQRTFFMLVCAAIGFSGRLPLSGYQAVAWAAAIMTVLDPWSVLSTGFWLSFAAVSTLIVIAEQAPQWRSVVQTRWQRLGRVAMTAVHLQWVMTIGTTPILAYLFHQVSFASMPANAWAIPWITFVATPLALMLSASCLLPLSDVWLSPLAWLAHESLYGSLRPVRWLAGFEVLAVEVSAMPLIWLVLGLFGVMAAVCLPPTRWRGLG
jgi:competence protein ComEC